MNKKFENIRRDYGVLALQEADTHPNPFTQFTIWFDEILETHHEDPSAMVLATVDECGFPDTRILLLKGVEDNQFIFYTHYLSRKGLQMAANPQVSLCFYWPAQARQVRIRGIVSKTTRDKSAAYFSSRPVASQLSAIASAQSMIIESREVLESKIAALSQNESSDAMTCPEDWGGYQVKPVEFEFWQGRNGRVHDRLRYAKENGQWEIVRLAP